MLMNTSTALPWNKTGLWYGSTRVKRALVLVKIMENSCPLKELWGQVEKVPKEKLSKTFRFCIKWFWKRDLMMLFSFSFWNIFVAQLLRFLHYTYWSQRKMILCYNFYSFCTGVVANVFCCHTFCVCAITSIMVINFQLGDICRHFYILFHLGKW